MTLCDAGPLFALFDKPQPKYTSVRKAFTKFILLVTTWSCFTEAMYLALHRGGWMMQHQLGKLVVDGLLTFYEIQPTDYSRLFKLMEKYRDRPMDLGDATLVLAAEQQGHKQILTLDSDFFFYLINDSKAFDVISLE